MINNSYFKTQLPPKSFNPIINKYDYREFWRTEKQKCIEGFWVSGKWMPGPLYYYINYHHIDLEMINVGSQGLGLPNLRDIDWELFLLYEECRGFSGFADDPEFTCNRLAGPEKNILTQFNLYDTAIANNWIRKEDLGKKYIPAREYLRGLKPKNYGKPLYQNNAQNFISLQARGSGKTRASGALIAHNFLFGGAKDYDAYVKAETTGNKLLSTSVAGAYESKWSMPLLDTVIKGIENIPGDSYYNKNKYKSPIAINWGGSKAEGDARGLFHKIDPNDPNKMGSNIFNRAFSSNPLAGNSGRPNLVVLDEIGFFKCIEETLGAFIGSEASKERSNMVVWMLGTGGVSKGEAVLYAEKVFRNPEKYKCLAFEDTFENRGTIGYFVPITKTTAKFKEPPNFITKEEDALKYELSLREPLKKNKSAYQAHIVNSPLVPSEALLVIEGNTFPTMLLKEQLGEVLGGRYSKYLNSSWKGWLKYDENDKLYFEDSVSGLPIRNHPTRDYEDKKGLIEMWCKPYDDNPEWGRYIAGIDVVDKAKSTTDSLPCIIVMDRLTRQIVCEYTGRTDDPKFFYEMCKRILTYYNASAMYEQNLVGLYNYFDQYKCLYLLADTPAQLRNRETFKENSNTSKGVQNTGRINPTGCDWINSWLLTPIASGSDTLYLNTIFSPAILTELIRYTPEINTDRVSALIMLMWHDETLAMVKKNHDKEVKGWLEHDYFVKRGLLKNRLTYED